MIVKHFYHDDVHLAISDRADGNMRSFSVQDDPIVLQNQQNLLNELGLSIDQGARLKVTYKRTDYDWVSVISESNLKEFCPKLPEDNIPISDILVTTLSDVGLILPLADCLGVVLFDPEHRVLALVHGGRQTLEQRGIEKAVSYLKNNYHSDPAMIKAILSPCARSNYPLQNLDNKTIPEVGMEQLRISGIKLENIFDFKIDTTTDPNYPSNSQGDTSERFAIAVKMF